MRNSCTHRFALDACACATAQPSASMSNSAKLAGVEQERVRACLEVREQYRASRRTVLAAGAAIALGAAGSAVGYGSASAQDSSPIMGAPPQRSIMQIGPDLYRVQEGLAYSVFIVTRDGIVATDPMGADAAAWLRAEIDRRFALPVRYVVYSHNHPDHVAGGGAFADTATFVAHERAREGIMRFRVPTPEPQLTFGDQLTLELGGRRVELAYHGPNDGLGSITMLFPHARTLFAVDWLVIGRVGYKSFARYDVEGTIRSLARVEAMDFEVAAPGHGVVGNKAGVATFRRYLETLRDTVLEHVNAGRSLGEIQVLARHSLKGFAHLAQFDAWVDLNIAGIHEQLVRSAGLVD